MGYYDFPHTRNYDQDLGFLIKKYNELGDDYKDLIKKYDYLTKIYELVKQNIDSITREQLKEWLDDGTLEKLLNDVLFKSKISYYNNVNEMIKDTTLTTENTCVTLGYYEENDGGLGLYKINKKNGQSNIGNNIYLDNGLVATLIEKENEINLANYGIKQYDENEPLNFFDNTSILNFAINKIYENGGIINFPVGKYGFKGSIILRPNITITGINNSTSDKNVSTTLLFKPDTLSDFFITNENDRLYDYIFNITIKNLTVEGDDVLTNKLFNLDHVARSNFIDITTRLGLYPIYLNFGMTNIFERVKIYYPVKIGILFDNKDLINTTQKFDNCYIGNSSYDNAIPIYLTASSSTDVVFSDCVIESIKNPVTISQKNKVTFNELYVENCPRENVNPTFKIGILEDESDIAGGDIDNTIAPAEYTLCGNVTINNSFIQGSNTLSTSTTGLNCFEVQTVDILTINNSTLSRFNKPYEIKTPKYISNKIGFYNSYFDNVVNVDYTNYSTVVSYVNSYSLNSLKKLDSIEHSSQKNIQSVNSIDSSGWYAFGAISNIETPSNTIIFNINTNYSNNEPEGKILALALGISSGVIKELVTSGANVIDGLRVIRQYEGSKEVYLEYHYKINTRNDVIVNALPSYSELENVEIYPDSFKDTSSNEVVAFINL